MNLRVAPLLIGIFIVLPISAEAFSSFELYGGAYHKRITEEALSRFEFADEPLHYLNQGLLEPDKFYREEFTEPKHHFTAEHFQASLDYLRNKRQFVLDCAEGAPDDYQQYRRALFALGEYLHAVQDFYSHTNWVERAVVDGRQEIPLASFDSLATSSLVSPYFLYQSLPPKEITDTDAYVRAFEKPFYEQAELEAMSDEQRVLSATNPEKSFTHHSLAKDNPDYPQSSVVWRRGGSTLFELAYDVAVRDTRRQWPALRESIWDAYPERGASIAEVLRGGWAGDLPSGDGAASLKVTTATVRVNGELNIEAACALRPATWTRQSAELATEVFVELLSDQVSGEPLYDLLQLRKNRAGQMFDFLFRTDLRGVSDSFIALEPVDPENLQGEWEMTLRQSAETPVKIDWTVEGPGEVSKVDSNRFRLSPPPGGWVLPEWSSELY